MSFGSFIPGFGAHPQDVGGGDDDNPLLVDMAAWWPMDEIDPVGDRQDSHIHDYTIEASSAVEIATGVVGGAVSVTGISSSVLSRDAVPDEAWQMGTGDFTVALWFKARPERAGEVNTIVNTGGTSASDTGWGVTVWSSNFFRAIFAVGNSNTGLTFNGHTVVVGEWNYIIVEWDRSGTLAAWINGVKDPNELNLVPYEGSDITSTHRLRFGGRADRNDRYAAGDIDEVALWNRLLTAEEKDWLYNNGVGRSYEDLLPPPELLPGLAAWWSMDETASNRLDSHTNGYDFVSVSANFVAGKIDNALSIDQVSAHLVRANAAESWQMGASSMTVAFWVQRRATGEQSLIACGAARAGDAGWRVAIDSSGRLEASVSDGTSAVTASFLDKTTGLGSWNYVVVEFDRAGLARAWMDNGISAQSVDISGFTGLDIQSILPLYVGREAHASINSVTGYYDEVAVWNRLLTDAERAWLFNGGAGRAYNELT